MWLRSLLNRSGKITGIAALAVAAMCPAPAAFAALNNLNFTVAICENEAVLANPHSVAVKMSEMWDTSTQRIMARSMPFLQITNEATAGNLLSMTITIGDTRFNFSDDYFGVYVRPGASAPAGAIASATGGDVLTITFGNGGLSPGQSLIFQIDLDSDNANQFPMPDFRTVLFDMNGLNVYDDTVLVSSADNAEIQGTFVDTANNANTQSTTKEKLEDYTVTGAQAGYYNQYRRPYGQMEGIDIFEADPSLAIPEPSTLALAGLLVGGVIAFRRRRA